MRCELFFDSPYQFTKSLTETPNAFANFAIVASVGFVFPFSIVLTKPRPTFSVRAMSPCVMPFLVLIFLRFEPSFADSFCIIHSIPRCYSIPQCYDIMEHVERPARSPIAHTFSKKSRAKQIKNGKAMGRGRNAEGIPEALAELLELAQNRSVRLGLEPPRTRSVRINPVLVQNRFEQSRVIQHQNITPPIYMAGVMFWC